MRGEEGGLCFLHYFHSSVSRNAKNDEDVIVLGSHSSCIACRIGC